MEHEYEKSQVQKWLEEKYENKTETEIKFDTKNDLLSIPNERDRKLTGELVIEGFENLTTINLGNAKEITKITILNCPKISLINVYGNQIACLEGLNDLEELTDLNIGNNRFEELDFTNFKGGKLNKLTLFGNEKLGTGTIRFRGIERLHNIVVWAGGAMKGVSRPGDRTVEIPFKELEPYIKAARDILGIDSTTGGIETGREPETTFEKHKKSILDKAESLREAQNILKFLGIKVDDPKKEMIRTDGGFAEGDYVWTKQFWNVFKDDATNKVIEFTNKKKDSLDVSDYESEEFELLDEDQKKDDKLWNLIKADENYIDEELDSWEKWLRNTANSKELILRNNILYKIFLEVETDLAGAKTKVWTRLTANTVLGGAALFADVDALQAAFDDTLTAGSKLTDLVTDTSKDLEHYILEADTVDELTQRSEAIWKVIESKRTDLAGAKTKVWTRLTANTVLGGAALFADVDALQAAFDDTLTAGSKLTDLVTDTSKDLEHYILEADTVDELTQRSEAIWKVIESKRTDLAGAKTKVWTRLTANTVLGGAALFADVDALQAAFDDTLTAGSKLTDLVTDTSKDLEHYILEADTVDELTQRSEAIWKVIESKRTDLAGAKTKVWTRLTANTVLGGAALFADVDALQAAFDDTLTAGSKLTDLVTDTSKDLEHYILEADTVDELTQRSEAIWKVIESKRTDLAGAKTKVRTRLTANTVLGGAALFADVDALQAAFDDTLTAGSKLTDLVTDTSKDLEHYILEADTVDELTQRSEAIWKVIEKSAAVKLIINKINTAKTILTVTPPSTNHDEELKRMFNHGYGGTGDIPLIGATETWQTYLQAAPTINSLLNRTERFQNLMGGNAVLQATLDKVKKELKGDDTYYTPSTTLDLNNLPAMPQKPGTTHHASLKELIKNFEEFRKVLLGVNGTTDEGLIGNLTSFDYSLINGSATTVQQSSMDLFVQGRKKTAKIETKFGTGFTATADWENKLVKKSELDEEKAKTAVLGVSGQSLTDINSRLGGKSLNHLPPGKTLADLIAGYEPDAQSLRNNLTQAQNDLKTAQEQLVQQKETCKVEKDQVRTQEHEQIISKIITDLGLATKKEATNALEAIIIEIKSKINPDNDNSADKRRISELETELKNLKSSKENLISKDKLVESVEKEKSHEIWGVEISASQLQEIKAATSAVQAEQVRAKIIKSKVEEMENSKSGAVKLSYLFGTLTVGSLITLGYLLVRSSSSLPTAERKEGKK